jgi:hypothetical protein
LVAALGWTAWQGVPTTPLGASQQDNRRVAEPGKAAPPAAAVATTRLAQPERTPPLATGDIEICGVGVAKNEADAKALEDHAYKDISTALAAHAVRMVRSTDARTRAVGLLIAGQREALAGMAWQSADPLVYQLALQACGFVHDPPAERRAMNDIAPSCAQLSVERGAALDANNGHSWMQAATEAAWRGEADNQAYAYRRASEAPEFRSPAEQALVAITMAALPQDAGRLERLQVGAAILGVQAAMPVVYAAPLNTYCADSRLRNANTRQECEALADAMVRLSASYFGLSTGLRLGRRLGWPAERIALMEAELRLSDTLQEIESSAPGGVMGCAARDHAMRRWTAIAEHGERQAARLLLADQAMPPAK